MNPLSGQRKDTLPKAIYSVKNKLYLQIKMAPRKIHLEDFPKDIRAYVSEAFRKNILKNYVKKRGNHKLVAREFGVSRQLVEFWLNGKRAISLSALRQILKNEGLALNDVEQEIVAYVCMSPKKITNPKIPILETPELIEFIVHMLCDGTAERGRNTPRYINKNQALLNHFERLLTQFGNVPFSRGTHYISFPKTITEIVREFYKIGFGTFTGMLPKDFLNLPKTHALHALSALIDDEGHINDNGIFVSLSNKPLFENFVKLIKLKIPEIRTGIVDYSKTRNGKVYTFRITQASLLKLDDLPLQHPAKKEEFQYQKRRLKNKKWLNYVKHKDSSRQRVLDILSNKNKYFFTAKEIAKQLELTTGLINRKLKLMKEQGLVICNKVSYSYKWGINSKC